jgi:hypothetical protein
VFFSEGTPTLAVEGRRVGWRRLSHVESHAAPWREDEEGNWIKGGLMGAFQAATGSYPLPFATDYELMAFTDGKSACNVFSCAAVL